METSDVTQELQVKNSNYITEQLDNNVLNDLTLQVIGQMTNITHINPNCSKFFIGALNNVARSLAKDTIFLTRRGKRCIPTVFDATLALQNRKILSSFSQTPSKLIPLKQNKQSVNDVTLFFPDDPDVDLREVISKDPNKVSYEISLSEHWLSIYSVQPATPENPTPMYIHKEKKVLRDKVYPKGQKQGSGKDSRNINSEGGTSKSNTVRGYLSGIALGFNGDRMPAKVIEVRPHFVGTEHQVYFKTLTEACVGNDENARNNALMTIKNDKALDPLLPHLMQFIAEGIRLNIIYQNLAVLIYLVRIVRSLVDNPNVNLDPYLHRILPALLSVVLCGNICLNPITDNHFALRKFAGKVVNGICERQHTARNELVNRLCTVLVTNIKQTINTNSDLGNVGGTNVIGNAQSQEGSSNIKSGDFTMRLNTLCGSVLCLSELSQEAIRQCLVPKIGSICQFLTGIIKSKGSTLPGAEDKAICSLKDILLSDKVVKVLYEFRVSNGLDMSQESCIREYGSGMGMKYFDFFCKASALRNLQHQQQTTTHSVQI